MPKICLIDGSGFIFRAFHALPPLRTKDGRPVNAVYGFTKSIMSLQENRDIEYIVVIFDASRLTFRQDIYKEYKAQRPPAPEDLIPQFDLIREVPKALNIISIEMDGFEADDLIATYTKLASEKGLEVEIVSSDKDLMQLVSDDKNIYIFDALKRKIIKEAQVLEKFGVSPAQVIDVQALMGDSSDNVPGVKGIGVKGAMSLINEFGSLDGVYENIETITKKALKENLQRDKELAYISKRLVNLKDDIKVETPIDELKSKNPDPRTLCEFLQSLSFDSLAVKIANKHNINLTTKNFDTNLEIHNSKSSNLLKQNIQNKELKHSNELQDFIKDLAKNRYIPLMSHFHSNQRLERISIYDENKATNFSIILSNKLIQQDIFSQENTGSYNNITESGFFKAMKNILEDQAILKIGNDIKQLMHIAKAYNIYINSYEDIIQMSYVLLGTTDSENPLVNLIKDSLSIEKYEQDTEIPAQILLDLHNIYKYRIIENKVKYLYEVFDRPLIEVLFEMEKNGILVDKSILEKLSEDFKKALEDLTKKIFAITKQEFNIGSPKQLGEILFEKMGIESKGRKSKSGSYKTDVSVLEAIFAEGFEIAELILKWRQISKLKNTYTDKLPEYMNPHTQRIHTTFLTSATSTGRLSSINPNLQNIPIKSDEGKQIRKSFIAKSGYNLISLDYSQIELRILATIAKVESLITAFENKEDIHRRTASEIFKTPLNEVNDKLRREAKAINFGIIYGQTSQGLASSLGINKEVANNYIESYFLKYPEIKTYMEETKDFAQKYGFVTTLFNRRCYVEDINSLNISLRSFAQRASINARIQGTGADIMRKALIDIHKFIKENKLDIKLLLQIHDEILLEANKNISNDIIYAMKTIMENTCNIGIPLQVDFGISDNWFEA